MLNAYDISPSSPSLNFSLARVLIKGRQHELASYLLSRAYAAAHSDEARARLRAILEDLEDGEVDFGSLDR